MEPSDYTIQILNSEYIALLKYKLMYLQSQYSGAIGQLEEIADVKELIEISEA